jgi:hypothetical protein
MKTNKENNKKYLCLSIMMWMVIVNGDFYNPCARENYYFIKSGTRSANFPMCMDVDESNNKVVVDYCVSDPNFRPSMVWNFENGVLRNGNDRCLYGNKLFLYAFPCSQVMGFADKWKYRCDDQFENVNKTTKYKCLYIQDPSKGRGQRVEMRECTYNPIPDEQEWYLAIQPTYAVR